MKGLSTTKPRLKPHRLSRDDRRIIVEDETRPSQVSLPLDALATIELLQGELTVREIVEKLMAGSGRVSFRSLFTTLETLDEAGLLTEPLGLRKTGTRASAPFERPEAFFMRPLFELTLLRRLELRPLANVFLLAAVAAAITAVAGDTVWYWLEHFSTRGFLMLSDAAGRAGYARAIPALVLLASLLMTLKGLGKALLLLLATGQLYNLRLRLHAFGISLGVSDV
ncbi:MAG: hypothetical protein HY075_13635, partial [Deltaproteobacteria bacterium]|nr:hypothetical protein [Deltaproteobacteria bacterium]